MIGFIFFFINQLGLFLRTDLVFEDLVSPESFWVLLGKINRLVVIGPDEISGRVLDDVLEGFSCGQIFEVKIKKAASISVHSITDEILIRRLLEGANLKVFFPFAEFITVEQ